MNEYKLAYDKIRNLITTRKADEWEYIVERVKEEYNQDISDTVPVFLTSNDFLKKSSNFNPGAIFISWYAYKKTPVLIVESFEELEKAMGKQSSDELRAVSHFIE